MGKEILNYDVSLWVEFNKEVMTRKIIAATRLLCQTEAPKDILEFNCGTQYERIIAESAINKMISRGELNKYTFLEIGTH